MSSTNGIVRKKVTDLVGKKFNRLLVVEYLGEGRHRKHRWKCLCDCGNTLELNTSSLTSNRPTKSCGCLRKETLEGNRKDPTKHGLHGHKLYRVYQQMWQRCTNPNSQRWDYYGAKGGEGLLARFPFFLQLGYGVWIPRGLKY
jgi:hypothetical protein